MNLREFKSAKDRREALEKELSISLEHTSRFTFDEETVSGRNCENLIGTTQIPLGIAGPLYIKTTKHQNNKTSSCYIPLATTEGALVASVNRGCKAVRESDGALVNVHKEGATRGPVFYTKSLSKGEEFYHWLKRYFIKLQRVAEETSNHLSLKRYEIRTMGQYAFVRFYFDTQDAMGMNMATIATQKIVKLIEKETGIKCLSLAGNFDTDKKPAWLNFINNRGFKAWSEAVIKQDVVKKVLKTTPQKIYDVWLGKCMLGSAVSGSLGFNAHYANIIAAMFIATGQDPAHVVEGSLGVTTTKITPEGDLYLSVYLPALMVGTVGGGTGLATQKESLKIMGIAGGNDGKNARRFAEITAGAVLAGELSLLASLAEGTLAKAHGRNHSIFNIHT